MNMPANRPIISVRGLSVGYGNTPVLRDISFDCRPGQFIGLARSLLPGKHRDLHDLLERLQNALFDLGADLATRMGSPYEKNIARMDAEDVRALEEAIDRYQEESPPFQGFILPGGHPAAAALHLARTVVRRAERKAVALSREEPVNPEVIRYLNRLSDLLFVLARVVNAREGIKEEGWLVKKRR